MVLSCLWRSGLSGFGLGFFFGSTYGMLVIPLAVAINNILTTSEAVSINDPGAGVALGIAAAIGWALGGSIGAPAGLLSGLVNGLLIAALLSRRYYPTSDARAYRKLARRACGVSTVIVILVLYAFVDVIGRFEYSQYGLGEGANPERVDLFLVLILPTIVAGVVNGWAGGRLALWYLPRI